VQVAIVEVSAIYEDIESQLYFELLTFAKLRCSFKLEYFDFEYFDFANLHFHYIQFEEVNFSLTILEIKLSVFGQPLLSCLWRVNDLCFSSPFTVRTL